MASGEKGKVLGAFYDDGAYTQLAAVPGSAVGIAYGTVGGQPVYAVCQNGQATGAAELALGCKAAELAAKTGNPIVTFYDSKGVRLEDGIEGLSALAKLNEAAAKVSGVVPQIAVVTGVCGGTSAMAAASADLLIMTKDAELFLTAPFISEAAGDKVKGAGSAEFAVNAGVAAIVVEDAEAAAAEVAKLVALLPGNNLSAPAGFEYEAPAVQLAAGKAGIDAVAAIADDGSAIELFEGFGGGVVTSLATVAGSTVGIVATAGKGTTLGNKCITRAARFVRLCDAYSIPVVTVIDTDGFTPASSSDEAGAIRGAARLAATYADATTAKVAVFTGKAIGSAYAAFASADLAIAVEGCVVAIAEPTAVVSVVNKDEIDAADGSIEAATNTLARTYEAEKASAEALLAAGVADMTAKPAEVRAKVSAALDILVSKRVQRIAKKHGNMAL